MSLIFWVFGLLGIFLCFFLGPMIGALLSLLYVAFLISRIGAWLKILVESSSGNIKQAQCPGCEKLVNFWVPTAFACPYCHHTLMEYENRLYDITR